MLLSVYLPPERRQGEVKSLSRVRLFATPQTVAYQALPSMGFSRQEYWSGVPSVNWQGVSITSLLFISWEDIYVKRCCVHVIDSMSNYIVIPLYNNNASEIVSAFLEIFCERFLQRTYRGPPGFLTFCLHLAGDHPQNFMSLSCHVLLSLALNYAYTDMFLGEGNGNPLQCSCLENPRDRGAWWAAVYGVAQSWTRLSSSSSRTCFSSHFLSSIFLTGPSPEVPNLQDLTPSDLRWSWCNNNRNKGHNKCNVLESSWTHPPPPVCGEIVFQEPGPRCQKGWGPTVYIIQTTKYSALHFMKK